MRIFGLGLFTLAFGISLVSYISSPLPQGDQPSQVSQPGSSFTYKIDNVPDFDQWRAKPPSVGLPNRGAAFCMPTAAIDWMGYIAEHGISRIPPGDPRPSDWNYDEVTQAILSIAGLMKTDSSSGTPLDNATDGLINYLAQYKLASSINVAFYEAEGESAPTAGTMAENASERGDFIIPLIGFYNRVQGSGSSIQTGWTRCGGHVVALSGLDGTVVNGRVGGTRIYVSDPNTPGENFMGPPNSSSTDLYAIQDAQDNFYENASTSCSPVGNPYHRTQTRLNSGPYEAYHPMLDGYWSLSRLTSVSANSYDSRSSVYVSMARFSESSEYHSKESPQLTLQGPVSDISNDPISVNEPFIRAAFNEVFEVNLWTHYVRGLAEVPLPKRLVLGDRDDDIFVLCEKAIYRLVRSGQRLRGIDLNSPADAIAYDDVHQWLLTVSDDGVISTYDQGLDFLGSAKVSTSDCERPAKLWASTDPSSGDLWLHCDGMPFVYHVGRSEIWRTGDLVAQKVYLEDSKQSYGLSVDKQNHLFLTEDGKIREFDSDGRTANTTFLSGQPGGNILTLSRPFSNFDPRFMVGPAFYNVIPPTTPKRLAK